MPFIFRLSSTYLFQTFTPTAITIGKLFTSLFLYVLYPAFYISLSFTYKFQFPEIAFQ